MKKLILMLPLCFVIFAGCKNDNYEINKSERIVVFEKHKEMARTHSDYLSFVLEKANLGELDLQIFTRSSGNEVYSFTDVLKNTASDFVYHNIGEDAQFIVDRVNKFINNRYLENSQISPITRSSSGFIATDGNEVFANFMNEVSEFEQLTPSDFKTEIEKLLFSGKYSALSDSEFSVLSVTAATWLDSYEYWMDNYELWQSQFGNILVRGSSFWRDLWDEIKRISICDAECALEAAVVCGIMATPLTLEVAFVSAGVGSLYGAFEPYL